MMATRVCRRALHAPGFARPSSQSLLSPLLRTSSPRWAVTALHEPRAPDRRLATTSAPTRSNKKASQASLEAKTATTTTRSTQEISDISAKFQRVEPIDHVLLRPDTYVGSTRATTDDRLWVWDAETKRLVERECTFVPGLYKIFDEILVNAADNATRDPSMKYLKVEIDAATGLISVLNDGKGIPIEMHETENIYIPELLFGHLMTGENFNDQSERIVGGRNGFGAKLTNIFSKSFTLETKERHTLYTQTWRNNMSICEPPILTKAKGSDSYTKITFLPDYERFGLPKGLNADHWSLFAKRAHDMAGVTRPGVRVSLNGEALKTSSFEDLVNEYLGNTQAGASVPSAYLRINPRWEICVAASASEAFNQVSFVNGVATYRGGKHVDYITDQIVKYFMQELPAKTIKDLGQFIKPSLIKSNLWVFVNATIVNPVFSSQTKDELTTPPNEFGPSAFLPKLEEAQLKRIVKTIGILERVQAFAEAKAAQSVKRMGGKKVSKLVGIDKLTDANYAGSFRSSDCTLILTEGDSAMTLALSGLDVLGRDKYGVFPLRGKLLNARDATSAQMAKNEEIQNLMKILGLRPGERVTNVAGLRYGKVMVMTDQDHDGSHIKGLLFNFFDRIFPGLIEQPGFLKVFFTPIVKAGGKAGTEAFYTLHAFAQRQEEVRAEAESRVTSGDAAAKSRAGDAAVQLFVQNSKYYKGLGTNTPEEAKAYFQALERHVLTMTHTPASSEAIGMAFDPKRAQDRKTWLAAYDAVSGPRVEFTNSSKLSFDDFVHGELVLYSLYDNVRSIPNVLDGLKPSQRKVLYGCFASKLDTREQKVNQLAGYIAGKTAYHHGEASLATTIVGMAQDFVGSNNVPLLHAGGTFGTRRLGGKDAASPRYIHTRLRRVARLLFRPEDLPSFPSQRDDGMKIEPRYYVPVIPTILLNGASGIGTGWSTEIPMFNPRDVIRAVRERIVAGGAAAASSPALTPWYRGSRGAVLRDEEAGRFTLQGDFSLEKGGEIMNITELPVGVWTDEYKKWLEERVHPKKELQGRAAKLHEAVTEFQDLSSIHRVHLRLRLAKGFVASLGGSEAEVKDKLLTMFNLQSKLSLHNMMAFDERGRMRKFESPEEILDVFMPIRRGLYVKRRERIVDRMTKRVEVFKNQALFVRRIVQGEISVTRKKKLELLRELKALGFPLLYPRASEEDISGDGETEVEEESVEEVVKKLNDEEKGYDYLLKLPIWNLTLDRAEALEKHAGVEAGKLEAYRRLTPDEIWLADLNELEAEWDAMEKSTE